MAIRAKRQLTPKPAEINLTLILGVMLLVLLTFVSYALLLRKPVTQQPASTTPALPESK